MYTPFTCQIQKSSVVGLRILGIRKWPKSWNTCEFLFQVDRYNNSGDENYRAVRQTDQSFTAGMYTGLWVTFKHHLMVNLLWMMYHVIYALITSCISTPAIVIGSTWRNNEYSVSFGSQTTLGHTTMLIPSQFL